MDSIKLEELIKAFLSQKESVHLAILFGSYGCGRQTPKSDVDLAIDTGSALTLENRQLLHKELTKLVEREVDLIDLRSVRGTILLEALQGKVLKKNSSDEYATLIKSAIIDKEDFGRIRDRVLKIRRENYFGSLS